jgi:hypothetical protein
MAGESPMKKTYCDVDGKQCVNTTVLVHIAVRHHTKDGQVVGEDFFKTIEVCTDCEELLKRIIPQAFVMDHSRSEEPQMESPIAYNENARTIPSRADLEEAMERRRNGE